jgi:glutamate 5-kinase
MQRRQQLIKAKRVVVKVGTSLLSAGRQELDQTFLATLASEVAEQRRAGREVILVTSGAIGMGLSVMRMAERPRTIPGKQALAAIGQPHLMRLYAQVFSREQLTTAQVLLTADDITDRQRYAHARAALEELLRLGVVPVFNENDTVAVDEIKFGDNDTLSAHVTNLACADLLVILTDVAGLYDANPAEHPEARLLAEVDAIDKRIEDMAAGPGTTLGTGGMVTKLRAAKMVTGMGEKMAIADGRAAGHGLFSPGGQTGQPQALDCIRPTPPRRLDPRRGRQRRAAAARQEPAALGREGRGGTLPAGRLREREGRARPGVRARAGELRRRGDREAARREERRDRGPLWL